MAGETMNDVATTEPTTVMQRNDAVRKTIVQLESRIKQFNYDNCLAEPECPLSHVFAPDAYARTIFIPKDTLLVGKIHKHSHLNMLMQGMGGIGSWESSMPVGQD